MKQVSLILIVTLFVLFYSPFNAQTVTALPKFKNDIVVIKVYDEYIGNENFGNTANGVLNVSDGSELNYQIGFKSLKSENLAENTSILAQVLNELKKQKYKLIATNSSSLKTSAIIYSNYILQKE